MDNQENLEIMKRLERLAYKKTHAFCYTCFTRAPSGRCVTCGSDDLMREREGDGVEYGCDWVIKHLIRENLTPVDLEEAFEDSIRDCYPETTKVGWLDLDTVTILKEMDPVCWRIALGEYEDYEVTEGQIMTFDNGSTYFLTSDIETYLDEESIE